MIQGENSLYQQAETNSRALKQLGIQSQTGKYQIFIYARKKIKVSKTHKKNSFSQ